VRGEYKVPGGKLVRAETDVVDGRLANVHVSGDFFLEPDSALEGINAALTGLPAEAGADALAHAVGRALGGSVAMIGFDPAAVAIAVRRAVGEATGWEDHTFDLIPPVVLDPVMHMALDEVLPVGFSTLRVVLREPGSGSLQQEVTAVTWELTVPGVVDVEGAVERVLGATTLPLERERKGERRIDDVRPAIQTLAVAGEDTVVADVATVGRGLRPAELAAVAFPGADVTALRALRTHQWIEHDGHRRDVMALPVAMPAPLVGA